MLNKEYCIKDKYIYHAFGITIASEIPLPELSVSSGIGDINIRMGQVPEQLAGFLGSNEHYQAIPNHLLMEVRDIGRYYISDGDQIIIEPAPDAEINAVRLFLLGSAMGALLLQRGVLPIHGSALHINDYCFIITGEQGAGKSTLAAALAAKGHPILTDDLAAVRFDESGIPWVYPSYPQQKLWNDSLDLMGKEAAAYDRIFGRLNKFAVPIPDGFCDIPKKLSAIYELRKEDCGELRINKLYGTNKMDVIMRNIYRHEFVVGLGIEQAIFSLAAALAEQVSLRQIIRPEGIYGIEDQVSLLETDLIELGRDDHGY